MAATNSITVPIVQVNSIHQASVTMYFPATGLLVQPATGTTPQGATILSSIQIVGLKDRTDGTPTFYSTLSASAISVLQNS